MLVIKRKRLRQKGKNCQGMFRAGAAIWKGGQ